MKGASMTATTQRPTIEVTRCHRSGQFWLCENCEADHLPEVWHISSLPMGSVSTWLCIKCLAQLTDAAEQAIELHVWNQS